jgi:hypothetical protein
MMCTSLMTIGSEEQNAYPRFEFPGGGVAVADWTGAGVVWRLVSDLRTGGTAPTEFEQAGRHEAARGATR